MLKNDTPVSNKILKTNILKFRREAKMTQQDLAELVNCRCQTIAQLENGTYRPSLKLAMDIAHVFDKTVEEVFIFIDNKNKN